MNKDYNVVVEKCYNSKGTGKAGWDVSQIVNRAETGGVDALIVGLGVHHWGSKSEKKAPVHERKQSSDEDLLNRAAMHTIVNGGKVYAVQPESVPDHQYAVALYRY